MKGAELMRGLPGLVRVVAGASWKALSWTVNSSVEVGTEVVRRTARGEPPAEVLRSFAWRALGLDDGTEPEDLRARGEQLLRRSADVTAAEEEHPAYARILSELTPEEARILRYLYQAGPQPAIDVRSNRELIAEGLNMIAEHAGCLHADRIHPYLTNLSRLGLVEFSKEQVDNPNRYQLVEAQPKVAEVASRAGRSPRFVRRSIHLNDFGKDFVLTCLPLDNGHRPTKT